MPQINSKSAIRSQDHGFTLVELLIAVSIIAILTVMGTVVFTGLVKQSRDGKRISDIDAIYNALELHYDPSANQYPVQIDPLWFTSSTIPVDPLKTGSNRCGATGTSPCEYCFRNLGSGQNECGKPPGSDHDIAADPHLPVQTGYSVCTSLEQKVNNLSYYCKRSARFNYN